MPSSCCNNALRSRPLPSELTRPATVTIGERPIGAGYRTYLVAEAGVNHDGSADKALKLVDVAVAAGADAVKFQVFRAAELASASAGTVAYQQAGGQRSQRAMLEKLELSDAAFARIRDHCRQCSIEFLATPFSLPDLDRLDQLCVRAIKIASTDLNNVALLRAACCAGLPLILSTGASTAEEIRTAVERLRCWDAGERLILLHCVSRYPTPPEAANLRAIRAVQAAFNLPCGFSDHTLSTRTGAWAVAAGACLLEKHFTLDRDAPGPDHAMSLRPDELARYVRAVNDVEAALGSGALGMSDLEDDVRAAARKSVVAATGLRAGTRLTADMLATKRPGGGIAPDQLEALVGRCLATDVPADTVLTWSMVR